MALTVEKPSKYLNEKLLSKLSKEAFLYLDEEFDIGVKFVCENCIKDLNKKYRGKDELTNVLTFNADPETKDGDIVICEQVVEREAKELGYETGELIMLYFVHGLLHLDGYSHEKPENRAKMEKAEEAILKKIGITISR